MLANGFSDREAEGGSGRMKRLRLIQEGVLYRNPLPAYKAECAYLPNLVPLDRDEILCLYRVGQAFYSVDGKTAKLRSRDGGRTWEEEGLVWDPSRDEKPHNYSAPHGARLVNGTLLLVATRYEGADPTRLIYNPDTGGMRESEAVLFRSGDGGRSWLAPEVIDLPGGGFAHPPSQVIELNSGRLFLACETWKSWDDARPLHIRGFAVFSDDGGRTWGDRSDFPSGRDKGKMYSHARYTRMLDGRICALQWTQNIGAREDYDLHFTVSDETGREWSEPRATGLPGQTSWAADLGGGVIAAACTQRKGMKPGIVAVLSEDVGRTWDRDGEVLLWDAVGQEYLGVEHKPSYPASHDNIAFGKPNLARLPDGTLLAAWWCTQACVTHARYAKLCVE